MNLDNDLEIFTELVQVTAESIGLPQVYVEKDYWVTKALRFLSKSSLADKVIFKGGTSLSKAYRLIDRFSEDIDLALFASDKTNNVRKKLLKSIERIASQDLTYLHDDERESKGSSFRKTIYQYPRTIKSSNFGQASSELVIEINTFTNPEPFESRKLQTLIAEMLNNKGKNDLIVKYGLESFTINVLSVRRTLVEKILGVIKHSWSNDPVAKLSDNIRHLYDICMILKHEEYRHFVVSKNFKLLCDVCIEEEKAGGFRDSTHFEIPLLEAPLFSQLETWLPSLNAVYTSTFSDLVYGDLPKIDNVKAAFNFIRESLDRHRLEVNSG